MQRNDTFTLYDGSEMTVLERPDGPGDALVMQFVLAPGAPGPPPHVHPSATEVFEVTDGEFEMLVDRRWRPVRAGESVEVPPGLRHTFRNNGDAEVVIRNVHDPHHDFERYIRSIAQLSHELETVSPSSPAAMARMAILWERHDDLIRPADPQVKVAMILFSAIGRALRLSVPG